MSDLGFLADDCDWCRDWIARPSRARGQRVRVLRFSGTATVLLGNCDECRELRLGRVEWFDDVAAQDTDMLLRWAFDPSAAPPRTTWEPWHCVPLLVRWHLAARHAEQREPAGV